MISTAPTLAHVDRRDVHGVPLLEFQWQDSDGAQHLSDWLLRLEPQLLQLPRAPTWRGRSGNETTARYASYNLLDNVAPESSVLKALIHYGVRSCLELLGRKPEPSWIQCWLNVIRAGESLEAHSHPYPLHGHLTLQTDGSTTHYDDVYVQTNEVGQLTVLAGPGVKHSVATYQGCRPRISIAFDLLPEVWIQADRYWCQVWRDRYFIPFSMPF